MAAGGSECLLYCFRYTPLSFDDKVEQDQKQHVVDTLLNTTVSNWKEEGMQVHLEYDLVVFGSLALQDFMEHTRGPGFGLAACTTAALYLLRGPKYITSRFVDRVVNMGIKFYFETKQATRVTEPAAFIRQHTKMKEQLKVLYSELISSENRYTDKSGGMVLFATNLWDNAMEESFLGDDHLEPIFSRMREYTVGKVEEEERGGLARKSQKKESNVFAVACILCSQNASFTVFINAGGTDILVFDPCRRDSESNYETAHAYISHFVSLGRLRQFLSRRIHESEAKWIQAAIVRCDVDASNVEYLDSLHVEQDYDEADRSRKGADALQQQFQEQLRAEQFLEQARSTSGNLFKKLMNKPNVARNQLEAMNNKWKSLYKSLIISFYHLKAARLNFTTGTRCNTFGSPANCLTSAFECILRKYHSFATKIDEAKEKLDALRYMEDRKPLFDDFHAKVHDLQTYLKSMELDNDLVYLHGNLRHISMGDLEPATVLDYFLKNCHSVSTRSTSIHDFRCLCGTGGESSVGYNPVGSSLISSSSTTKRISSARRCLAHNVFHLDISERRTCHTCLEVENHAQLIDSKPVRNLNFLFHLNISFVREAQSTLYIKKAKSNSRIDRAGGVSFNECLRYICKHKWRSHCPCVPECEICGLAASVECFSCTEASIRQAHEQCIREGKHVRLTEIKSEPPSIRGAKGRNRVSICLCLQCEKKCHSISNRLGMSAVEPPPSEQTSGDRDGKICVNCGTGQSFNSRFYVSNGPIKTLVGSENGETKIVAKEMFICQRCDELGLHPPMTTRSMFSEIKESKRFFDVVTSSFKKELDSFQRDLQESFQGSKADLKAYVEKLEKEMHHFETGESIENEIYGDAVDQLAQMQQKQKDLNNMKKRLASFDKKAGIMLEGKLKIKMYELKRQRDVLLAGKRGAMPWRAPHITAALLRSREITAAAKPCPVDSAVELTLHGPPTVFTLALDWGQIRDDDSAAGFAADSPWVMKSLCETLDLSSVFSNVSQDHDSDQLLFADLMEKFISSSSDDELLLVLQDLRSKIASAKINTNVISQLAGCAYIKSGGRVGSPNEYIEKLQKRLLERAHAVRSRKEPDVFLATQLETQWAMRYKLDVLGYCWSNRVKELYMLLSKELHQAALSHVESEHSTRYSIRAVVCRRIVELDSDKNRRSDDVDISALRHSSMAHGMDTACAFETYIYETDTKKQWFRIGEYGNYKSYFAFDTLTVELKKRRSYPVIAYYERTQNTTDSTVLRAVNLSTTIESTRLEKVNQILSIGVRDKIKINVPKQTVDPNAGIGPRKIIGEIKETEEEGGCNIS